MSMPMSIPLSPQRRRVLAGLAGLIAGPLPLFAGAQESPVRALAERYTEALLDADPFWASSLGLATPAQASRLPMAIAPRVRERTAAMRRDTLAALGRIDRRTLGDADRITCEMVEHHARDGLEQNRFPAHLLPIDHMGASELFMMAAPTANALSGFASVTDHRHHIDRLRALPAWCAQAETNLREGVRRGIVLPTVIIERTLPMLRALLDPAPERNPFMEPLKRLPPDASPAERDQLRGTYRDAVTREVIPAVARLADTLQREVLPHGRPGAGLGALPDGAAWYAQCVRSSTTTSLTPKEIHALGLAEVARLREEMRKLQQHYRFEGRLEDFLVWHGRRPEARPFKTEREVLDAYATLNQRIAPQLPRLFGRVPKAPLEIRPEPELTRDTASDHYMPPSPDGSRPGVFYAVITDPKAYATPRMATLFLHEGQPGHHYQGALAQELPLTRLQRFWFYDAYGEGWALYAETLGHQLGLYDDPNAYLGHLSLAMLRAVRLVVDTGLHDQGWSRERAIDYLQSNTGFNARDSRAQIERYMVAPGQALSYAIGRMRIESLRERSRAALGGRFSLAAFHDQVLGSGSLPLAVLEAKIERWIAAA
ncbi:MAG TPA: DUF885 domain-containing protein [Albitalea sp.]|nr:DUF885 domain-containing protein [Albitalea sp.]